MVDLSTIARLDTEFTVHLVKYSRLFAAYTHTMESPKVEIAATFAQTTHTFREYCTRASAQATTLMGFGKASPPNQAKITLMTLESGLSTPSTLKYVDNKDQRTLAEALRAEQKLWNLTNRIRIDATLLSAAFAPARFRVSHVTRDMVEQARCIPECYKMFGSKCCLQGEIRRKKHPIRQYIICIERHRIGGSIC